MSHPMYFQLLLCAAHHYYCPENRPQGKSKYHPRGGHTKVRREDSQDIAGWHHHIVYEHGTAMSN
jgi:hypothetical protein